jgi:hypothetical protein
VDSLFPPYLQNEIGKGYEQNASSGYHTGNFILFFLNSVLEISSIDILCFHNEKKKNSKIL